MHESNYADFILQLIVDNALDAVLISNLEIDRAVVSRFGSLAKSPPLLSRILTVLNQTLYYFLQLYIPDITSCR